MTWMRYSQPTIGTTVSISEYTDNFCVFDTDYSDFSSSISIVLFQNYLQIVCVLDIRIQDYCEIRQR